ncbi:MAG: hypothetical protein PVJ09_04940 [Candidatus Woesebacteria bacterium]|jgi:hypothetical protein
MHKFLKAKLVHKLILPLLFLTFFVGLLLALRSHAHSYYFPDETDHVAVGWAMHRFDKTLYTDLSTNHQPIPVLVGALITKLVPYNTLFQLVDRVRLSMFAFILLSSALLTIRFSWKGFLTSVLTQSVAYYYFGFHVLAESLAVPAISFIMLLLLEMTYKKQTVPKYWPKILDTVAFTTAIFWVGFNLLVSWPFLLISTVYYLIKVDKKEKMTFTTTAFILVSSLFLIIPFSAWFEETVYNMILYFIPTASTEIGLIGYLKLLVYPCLHWFYINKSPISVSIAFSSLLFLLTVIKQTKLESIKLKIKKTDPWRKKYRSLFKIIAFFALVSSLNTRVAELPIAFFNAFHLYPFVAAFNSLIVFFLINNWKRLRLTNKIMFFSLLFLLLFNNSSWWREKKDNLFQYYVEYDPWQAYANALKTVKKPRDTLLTATNGHGYMNMMADLPFAGRQNFHLPWSYSVPKLRDEFHQLLENNPPTFIYIIRDGSKYEFALSAIIKEDYQQLYRSDGRQTWIFMHNDAITRSTPEEWQKFEEQFFWLPEGAKVE